MEICALLFNIKDENELKYIFLEINYQLFVQKIMRNIILLLTIAIFSSCKNQDKSNIQKNTNDIPESVLIDIRTDTSNTWSNYHNVQQLSKQLKLQPIMDEADSIEIRFWFDHSLAKQKYLILLQRRKNKWKGMLFNINVRYVESINYDIITSFNKLNIRPVSGWEKLIKDLNQLKFQELTGDSESGTDGASYCVEILTPYTYTYYDYWEPEFTNDIDNQSSNMFNIIRLLEREFNVKRY